MFEARLSAADEGSSIDSDPVVVVVVSEHLRRLFRTRNQRFQSPRVPCRRRLERRRRPGAQDPDAGAAAPRPGVPGAESTPAPVGPQAAGKDDGRAGPEVGVVQRGVVVDGPVLFRVPGRPQPVVRQVGAGLPDARRDDRLRPRQGRGQPRQERQQERRQSGRVANVFQVDALGCGTSSSFLFFPTFVLADFELPCSCLFSLADRST